jgi:hypothetical protein
VILDHKVNIRAIVGAMLIVTAAIRLIRPLRERLAAVVRARLRPALLVLGVVHGLSNLGGGLLTVIVSSLYRDDKDRTRKDVAFGYGVMATIQLATLFATTAVTWNWRLQLVLPLVAGSMYRGIGHRVYRATGQVAYQLSLTALIAVFGVVLMLPQ